MIMMEQLLHNTVMFIVIADSFFCTLCQLEKIFYLVVFLLLDACFKISTETSVMQEWMPIATVGIFQPSCQVYLLPCLAYVCRSTGFGRGLYKCLCVISAWVELYT